MKLLFIYNFCTFGGVERVLLNRMETFMDNGDDVYFDVNFLYDAGGFDSFGDYLEKMNLSERIRAFLVRDRFHTHFELDNYDMVINIDTPSAFSELTQCKNLYVECHTSYEENRQYLRALTPNVRGVIVPSDFFKRLIGAEIVRSIPIFVLPNVVSSSFCLENSSDRRRIFAKRPVCYLSRLDELKNINEAIKVFRMLRLHEHIMFAVVGHGATETAFIHELKKSLLLSRTFIRPKIDFNQMPDFLGLLRDQKGLLFLPSKGESFSMTVAESMAVGLPAVVSSIPAHRELFQGDETFLYPLGEIKTASEKVLFVLDHWEQCSQRVLHYASAFSRTPFLKAWNRLIQTATGSEKE